MSDLAWAVKNGDLEQVKEMVEEKVGLAGNAHTFTIPCRALILTSR